ncbi:hypothetical protein phiAS5_ORF0033 [Aeromonas phage phiAS5]|uniref:Uncharacterized protein n=1 Tax=Aeromonas phage phiAS5 TaxID=879630 RepID=E1A2D0_9CAUD|nr:hypothetical protein phiAS5_ORF0033 [Aeromonas phage phiAS5]ADM79876.1 hypothetical protein phiAS5_ORF0033 [Aeromonas phage phiAS5]BES53018.1 hypothetical protein [Aeromonas phage phiWae14]
MNKQDLIESYANMNAETAANLTKQAIDIEDQEKLRKADICVGKILTAVETAAKKGLYTYKVTDDIIKDINPYVYDILRELGYKVVVDYASTRSHGISGTIVHLKWGDK